MSGTVLIGGGRGFVGGRLAHFLQKKGYEVLHISRQSQPNAITWAEVEKKGLPPCLAVVNLAGQNLMGTIRWNDSVKSEIRSSRLNTTSSLSYAIQKMTKPPKVFVCASAVGFYKPSDTLEYTEESSGGNFDFLSSLVVDWEKAGQLPQSIPTRHVIVRIGAALGRDGGTIKSMILPFSLGLGGPINSGKQWFPWIHVDDVAGIIAHAIEKDNVTGVLNAVAPNPCTNAEFTKAFARALWRPAFLPVPGFVMNLMLGSDRASVVNDGAKILPKRTLELGYKFIYPSIDVACKEFAHLLPNTSEIKL